MKRKHGFTLLEIMLVLVLLSVSAVAVIATLPVRHDDEIKEVAQSIFQRLQLLNEEAILSGRDYGLRIDEQARTLRFLSLEQTGWQKLDKNGIAADLQLEEGLALQYQAGGDVWQDEDRLFKPGSLFDEEMFAEQDGEHKQRPPQVFILSSGELTPFTLDIYVQNASVERGWQVQVQDNGQITLLAPGEHDEAR
ncbi:MULTISPECIES: type II secretion system minor pseudopilin GspH [Vibrio]|uniref:Type II secretion system protein H n=1 Tax=Vibrio ostreae TaxID=2841925 RepID=A0A975U9Q2_9VIBR|nr:MULTISPECIES: type II secretion system minor pseudopilin GspH [Vibrio]QXO17540.1 type II secretion system minor pseudopilin GspH [Vibrio ostreae]WGY48148.1 type II secretion system minor pseudopilin GspH [Vibrio sp. ABG19]